MNIDDFAGVHHLTLDLVQLPLDDFRSEHSRLGHISLYDRSKPRLHMQRLTNFSGIFQLTSVALTA